MPATATANATVLLNVEGLAVQAVQWMPDGAGVARLVTADPTATTCPSCGVVAQRVKEYVTTGPRDLPCGGGGLRLVWRKRRWHCDQPECPRASFAESVSAVPARARLTARLRAHAGDLVVDGICATVSAAGRATGLSWPTVMNATRTQAGPLSDQAPANFEDPKSHARRIGAVTARVTAPANGAASSVTDPGRPLMLWLLCVRQATDRCAIGSPQEKKSNGSSICVPSRNGVMREGRRLG